MPQCRDPDQQGDNDNHASDDRSHDASLPSQGSSSRTSRDEFVHRRHQLVRAVQGDVRDV